MENKLRKIILWCPVPANCLRPLMADITTMKSSIRMLMANVEIDSASLLRNHLVNIGHGLDLSRIVEFSCAKKANNRCNGHLAE